MALSAKHYNAFPIILLHALMQPCTGNRISFQDPSPMWTAEATCPCMSPGDQDSVAAILDQLNVASDGGLAEMLSIGAEKADGCTSIIPNSLTRNSALINMKARKCKCEYGAVIAGDAEECGEYLGKRYFAKDTKLKNCSCKRPSSREGGGMGKCCENYGSRFGSWGAKQCPSSLAEVVSDLKASPVVQAKGGKSGVAPTITSKYVIKVIDPRETNMLHKLLNEQPAKSGQTFLNPSCYILKLKPDGTSLLVQPKIGLEAAKDEYEVQMDFDLKGNFGWKGRNSSKLDNGFKEMFPDGMFLDAAVIKTGPPQAPEEAISMLIEDTETLGSSLGLMDYSLLAHIVMISEAEFNDKENGKIATANSDKPLIWAHAGDKFYIMTMGIIDMFMNQDSKGATAYRRAYNWFGNNVVYKVECRARDPDPVDATPYRTRFLRMFGYYAGEDCGACLFRQYKNCYTYFKSAYQERMSLDESESCAWAGGGQCDGFKEKKM